MWGQFFRVLYWLLPMRPMVSPVCGLWSQLRYQLLSHIGLRLWLGVILCRSLRRLLRRPHCLLLLLTGHRSLLSTRILLCHWPLRLRLRRIQWSLPWLLDLCGCRLCLRLLWLWSRFIHQFKQAALVHCLCLFRHHLVNLLLVLRFGVKTCLSECCNRFLVVLGCDQFLRFLEVLLVFLALLLFFFRLLRFGFFCRLTLGRCLLSLRLELRHVGNQSGSLLYRTSDGLQEASVQFLRQPADGQGNKVVLGFILEPV